MMVVDISDSNGILFSIEIHSISQLNRNKEVITELLQRYMFEFKNGSTLNEIKQKIKIILDADIYNQRIKKIKKINEISKR